MLILEKDIEAFLKARVEAVGGKYIKIPAVYENGIPDRMLILPGGKVAFVELKRPKGGRLSELQKYQHEKLRKLGVQVAVVKNYKEASDLITEMLGGDADEV